MENVYTVCLQNERTPTFRNKVYFKDRNEDNYVEEFIKADECAGDGGCIRVLKEAPFEWKDGELLRSTMFEDSFNFDRHYKAYILEVTFCQEGVWLKVDMPLWEGDIIVPQSDVTLEYYISYVDEWLSSKGFTIKIERLDCNRTDDLSHLLSVFSEGKAINVIGQLK